MADMRDEPLRDLPEVLTPEQCADVLQVSRATIRELIASGVIPAFKLGPRLTRVYREELLRVIEQSRIQGEDSEGDQDAAG